MKYLDKSVILFLLICAHIPTYNCFTKHLQFVSLFTVLLYVLYLASDSIVDNNPNI